jgi:DNA-binding transcriptional regulator GbsR (MarR family)
LERRSVEERSESSESLARYPEELARYVEDFGVLMEGLGMSRMVSRTLGALLVADPPEVTAGGLAERLSASRGSISAATRTLVQVGFIERTRPPGERKDHFRVKPDAWHELTRRQLEAVTQFRKVGERGVELAERRGLSERTRGNLREFRDFYVFWEQELPVALERWEKG